MEAHEIFYKIYKENILTYIIFNMFNDMNNNIAVPKPNFKIVKFKNFTMCG